MSGKRTHQKKLKQRRHERKQERRTSALVRCDGCSSLVPHKTGSIPEFHHTPPVDRPRGLLLTGMYLTDADWATQCPQCGCFTGTTQEAAA